VQASKRNGSGESSKPGKPTSTSGFVRVSEGTRTPDRLDHNQELYQLSYAHRGVLNLAPPRTCGKAVLAIKRGLRGEVVTPTKLRG
jgi:hypothetical protein